MLSALVVLTLGCAPRRPPAKATVAVREFQVDGTVTVVTGYHDPTDALGRDMAEAIAEHLRRLDHDAIVVPNNSATPAANLVVSGRITKIDGGSRAARLFMSMLGFGFTDYGAGGGFLRAEGQVARSDGTSVGIFGAEHQEKGTGWFWIRYGDSARHQIAGCIEDVGPEIAEMIDEGQYHGSSPQLLQAQSPASTTPGAATRSATDRLRELDNLHQQGLLTDGEYQDKRRKLLDEL